VKLSWKGQHHDEAVSCDCDGVVASFGFMVLSRNQGLFG
jgi:hypothetical protein